jgi:nitroimidazol reductase NimA-like FMN-containing flavoprotein (pyridoxamine 5'-phosphate oxidase superfamily)
METVVAELEMEECLALLARTKLGRLGFVRKGRPMILPVNYAFDGDVIVFRSGPGGKQSNVPLRRVAFEIDGVDEESGTGWSVVVQGHAFEITHTIDRTSAARRMLPIEPMAPGNRDHWIEVIPEVITGRRIVTA